MRDAKSKIVSVDKSGMWKLGGLFIRCYEANLIFTITILIKLELWIIVVSTIHQCYSTRLKTGLILLS